MSQQKLTKLAVEQIPAQGAEVVVWDTALPGFGVRVKPTGVRSYIIQYRDRRTGTSKRMTIGQHGELLTFDKAKKRARGILADALRGQDPVGERRAGRKAPNMADLASDYLERHAVPKKRPKSVRDDRAILEPRGWNQDGCVDRAPGYRVDAPPFERPPISSQPDARFNLENDQFGRRVGLEARQPRQGDPAVSGGKA